jgi:hypothetical protein
MKRTKECGNNHDADASYPASDNFQNRSPLDWFADSGASRHMTHNKALLRNFQPITQGTWTVSGIKNTTLDVHGIGEVHLTTQVIKTKKKNIYIYIHFSGRCNNLRSSQSRLKALSTYEQYKMSSMYQK